VAVEQKAFIIRARLNSRKLVCHCALLSLSLCARKNNSLRNSVAALNPADQHLYGAARCDADEPVGLVLPATCRQIK